MPAKTKNPDRKGADGKAWKKSHGAPAKVLSPEAQARKAEKEARRSKRVVGQDRGSNITMPRITWGWATETMAARWPNTRRVRMVDACLARGRGRDGNDDGGVPVVIESNPEAKPRKSGR